MANTLKPLLLAALAMVAVSAQTDEDIEVIAEATMTTLEVYGAIDSSRVRLALDDSDRAALVAAIRRNVRAATAGRPRDLWATLGWGVASGVAQGAMESFFFRYDYPALGGGAAKRWLTYKAREAGMFDQTFTVHKISREAMYFFDGRGYYHAAKYYGGYGWKSWLTMFAIRSATATLYRNWAKRGQPLYGLDDADFIFNFDFRLW
jgi:hypothetical protein